MKFPARIMLLQFCITICLAYSPVKTGKASVMRDSVSGSFLQTANAEPALNGTQVAACTPQVVV